jgi:lipopolysaccharide exporter
MPEELLTETVAERVPGDGANSMPRGRRPWRQIGSVARNFVVVGGATALGQGALVLAAPILARLYDPHDFGMLSLYAAILSVLLVAVSLRYDFAIPIATDAEEAVHLVALSVLLDLVASLVLGIVVLLWRDPICSAFGAPELADFMWILPVALFVAGFSQAAASWGVYHRLFPAVGRMRAMQGLGQAFSQGLLGVARVGPAGLIAGDLVGRIAGTEQLLRPLGSAVRSTGTSVSAMWRSAKERWGFARVMTVASLLNALSLQVPFLLIPGMFDLQSSGQYFLAYRMLILPASLVSAAVSQVFFGEASFRRGDQKRLHDLAFNVTISLFVIFIPVYLTVLVGGPALIEAVFGGRWTDAGRYSQIMAPGLVLWSVANPISTLLLVGRRERESLMFTAAELGLKTASLVVGAAVASLTVGLVVLTVATIFIEIGALWRFLRVGSVHLTELTRPCLRVLAISVPCLGIAGAVGVMVPPAFAAAILIGGAAAFGLSARLSPEPRALLSGVHD